MKLRNRGRYRGPMRWHRGGLGTFQASLRNLATACGLFVCQTEAQARLFESRVASFFTGAIFRDSGLINIRRRLPMITFKYDNEPATWDVEAMRKAKRGGWMRRR